MKHHHGSIRNPVRVAEQHGVSSEHFATLGYNPGKMFPLYAIRLGSRRTIEGPRYYT